jgi:hypothetical protein
VNSNRRWWAVVLTRPGHQLKKTVFPVPFKIAPIRPNCRKISRFRIVLWSRKHLKGYIKVDKKAFYTFIDVYTPWFSK